MTMDNGKQKSISKHGIFPSRFHCVLNIFFFVIGFSLAIFVSSYFITFPSYINFDSTLNSLSLSVPSSSTPPPTLSPLSSPPYQPLLLSPPPPPPSLVPLMPPSSPPATPPSPPPVLIISPSSSSLPPPVTSPPLAVSISPPLPSPPLATPISPSLPPPLLSPVPLESMSSNIESNTVVSLMHNLTNEELFARAISVSKSSMEPDPDNKKVKKVAYMFLTNGALPLAPMWEKYFEGNEGLYSIYVHPHPSYNDSWPSSSVFFNRRIPSQAVTWGTDSMMAAERRLLANSLLDTSNQRFVLLSESCIPIMNFNTTYNYLMNSNLSFVESYDNPKKPGRGRYNIQMSPHINITQWRKGSQWFEATRDLALKVISDRKYYMLFQDYCLPPCYFDEHYVPTLLNILYPELSTNRTVTFVDWSRGGPHPAKFGRGQITEEFFNRIRFGSQCAYNGNTTTMCFMFARKFAPDALEPLLRIAPSLFGFDP